MIGVTIAAKPQGCIAGSGACPGGNGVAGLVCRTCAVVHRAQHDRAVDVAVGEAHDHLLPQTRDEVAPVVVSRERGADASPGRGGFVAGALSPLPV